MGWMGVLPHARVYAHVAAVTLSFAFITYMQVVVGELVPKSLALRRSEALAVAIARPMLFFMALARPAVRLLRHSAAVILRGFDIPVTQKDAVHSPEELKLIATAARRMGILPQFQETLIHRALELEDVATREIMTPRQKIFSLPSNLPLKEASARVIDNMHSRVPVYDETRGSEHIVGVVYSKDLARLMFFRPAIPFVELELSQVMHDVLVVPETKTVLDLIGEFQQRRRQMAIVVDEYGSTVPRGPFSRRQPVRFWWKAARTCATWKPRCIGCCPATAEWRRWPDSCWRDSATSPLWARLSLTKAAG
jgi:CBS domain containing-hemolysin-like protein